MLSVSESYNKSIVSDYRDMPYRVTLAGAVVLDSSQVPKLTVQESVGGTSGVALGTANSATLKLTLREPADVDYTDMLVEPESGLVLPDGSIEWVPLGKFWVTGVSTRNDYKTVELTCADGMYHLTGDYESDLTYPAAVRDVAHEIVAKTGIDFVEPDEWPDVKIRKKPSKTTYRSAIGYCAGCCGKNARFNREGKLEFVWYTDTGITIERETQYLNGMTRLNNKPLSVKFEVTGAAERYAITVVSDANGNVFPSQSNDIEEGTVITLSVSPLYKYELASISAVTDQGVEVALFENSDQSEYTFVQPDSNVTVTAAFRSTLGGPYALVVSSGENGSVTANGSAFDEGEIATLTVTPDEGYSVKRFTTVPANVKLTASGENIYTLVMPKSDVSIAVEFAEKSEHLINTRVAEGEGNITVTNFTTGGSTYNTGNIIHVSFEGNLGLYESNVDMIQISKGEYRFTMPAYDVSIVAYFVESEGGEYSFLQSPSLAPSPTDKPYWAVFYRHTENVGANAKYYLVWFDSWVATGRGIVDGETTYDIEMDGYYYCQGENNGNDAHAWTTSTWAGNGSSSLTWKGTPSYRGMGYCLLASNANLYNSNDALIFEECAHAIGATQTSYLVDGVDVREKGALTFYACPDTYSTPLPGANWFLLNRAQVYTTDEDGSYTRVFNGTGVYALYADGVTVESVGKHFENVELEFFKLTFPSATIVPYMSDGSFYGSAVKTVEEECYIIICDPRYSSEWGTATGGLVENTCGLYGTNTTTDVFYNNSCIVCDCEVATASAFSLRSTSKASVAADEVTMTYTNPWIYEKMVPGISEVVQNITYTPANVKHRGNPALQAGDIVTVPDRYGNYHTVLIMQQTMNFGGGMNAEISCPGQTEKTKSFSANGPLTTQIKNEVNYASAALERKITASNALVYASLNNSIVKTSQTANANKASIEELVEWRGTTSVSLAEIEKKATANAASIELLVEYDKDGNPVAKGSVLVEAINGQSTVKISADVVDIEGRVNAEYINALGLSVYDTNGKLTFMAKGNACTVGQLTATADGLLAASAFDRTGAFRASMKYTSSGKLTVSNYGSNSAWNNTVYTVPKFASKTLLSGWSVGDEVFVIYTEDVPTGNTEGEGVDVIYHHAFVSGDDAVFVIEDEPQGYNRSLIFNHKGSNECTAFTYHMAFSNEGLLGGAAADDSAYGGTIYGGYLRIASDSILTGLGDSLNFHVDGKGVQKATISDNEGIELIGVSVRDVTKLNDANNSAYVECNTLADLITLINKNFDAIRI